MLKPILPIAPKSSLSHQAGVWTPLRFMGTVFVYWRMAWHVGMKISPTPAFAATVTTT